MRTCAELDVVEPGMTTKILTAAVLALLGASWATTPAHADPVPLVELQSGYRQPGGGPWMQPITLGPSALPVLRI